MPILSDWMAGDILLFSSDEGKDPIGSYIESLQVALTRLPRRHSRWVHAAIYLRDGLCVEAIGKRGVTVQLDSLGKRIRRSDVRVRRLRNAADGSDWTPDLGWRIAGAALSFLPADYPQLLKLRAALQSDVASHDAAMNAAKRGQKQDFYCSLLCHAALARAVRVDVVAAEGKHPLPCVFSLSDLFSDIDVELRRVD